MLFVRLHFFTHAFSAIMLARNLHNAKYRFHSSKPRFIHSFFALIRWRKQGVPVWRCYTKLFRYISQRPFPYKLRIIWTTYYYFFDLKQIVFIAAFAQIQTMTFTYTHITHR